jgi:hypothetical protein
MRDKRPLSAIVVFVVVCLIAMLVSFASSNLIMSDGFESGNFDAWLDTYGSPEIVSDVKHTGSYAAFVNASGTHTCYYGGYQSAGWGNHLFARAYYKFNPILSDYSIHVATYITNWGYNGLDQLIADAQLAHWTNDDYVWIVMVYNGTSQVSGNSPVFVLDTAHWYCLELEVFVDGFAGYANLYVDDILVANVTGVTNNLFGDPNHVGFGQQADVRNGEAVWWDDCVIADSYIGPTPTPTNSDPVVNSLHAWGYPGGPLDPAGEVSVGARVRMYSYVTDAETASGDLSVTIGFRAEAGSDWINATATWESYYGYWYVDWVIPAGATSGLYDVFVEVSDGDGGSALVIETGEFAVVNSDPVISYVHVWGYPGGLLDPGGSINTGERVRIYAGITDAETSSDLLDVTIGYRVEGGDWTAVAGSWDSFYGYWYYDWVIPGDAAAGLYDVIVNASDGDGGSVVATELGEFTVMEALSVTVTPASATLNEDQTQVFTATVSGGSGSESYQWYVDSVLQNGETSSTFTYTAALGDTEVSVTVTDAASDTASDSATVTVNSPTPTPTPTPTVPTPTPSPTTSPDFTPAPSPTTSPTQAPSPEPEPHTVNIPLEYYIVAAGVFIAVVATVAFLLLKKKK